MQHCSNCCYSQSLMLFLVHTTMESCYVFILSQFNVQNYEQSMVSWKYAPQNSLFDLPHCNSFSACENFWTCCSNTNPCKINEGDCDSDNHCIGKLRCGVGNCGPLYPNNSDCCETKGMYIICNHS